MKQRPLTTPRSTLRGAPVVGQREQVLGRVDELAGDAEHLAEDVGRAAGQAGQRGGGAEQAVGGLVDGAVAAERDDDVIALVGRLAAHLGGVAAGLGVDGVDLEAALQRVHDEVAQTLGDRRGVGVDDDQHPPLALRRRRSSKSLASLLGAAAARRGAEVLIERRPTPRRERVTDSVAASVQLEPMLSAAGLL